MAKCLYFLTLLSFNKKKSFTFFRSLYPLQASFLGNRKTYTTTWLYGAEVAPSCVYSFAKNQLCQINKCYYQKLMNQW